jgi:hypothetical protein
MLKNKICIYFFLVLLGIFPVTGLMAQDKAGGKVKTDSKIKDTDTLTGTSKGGLPEVEQEGPGDTDSAVSGFNNKSNAQQQPVVQRYLVGDTLHKIKSADDFWYADRKKNKELSAGSKGSKFSFWEWLPGVLSGRAARFVVWCVLIGSLVFFIVFYLMNQEMGLFASSGRNRGEESTPAEGLPENVFEINFETALAGSLAAADYRLSVRLLFLRLLKIMSEKKVIDYRMDKTNFDYLFHLNGTAYFNGFSELIRNYEYAWYGKFAVTEQQYGLIEKSFTEFQQQINHLS